MYSVTMTNDEELEKVLERYKQIISESEGINNESPENYCEILRLQYLLPLYISNKNIKIFNENEYLLRQISGLTVKTIGDKIKISGQAITQFEKAKSFPVNRIKELMNLYIEKAGDLYIHHDFRLINLICALFFFEFDIYRYTFQTKRKLFETFKTQIESEKIKNCFIFELEEYKSSPDNPIFPFWFEMIKRKDKVLQELKSKLIIDENEIINMLNRNLKTLRYLINKKQSSMAKILGITTKTYNYYENYNYKPGKNALDFNQSCSLINAIFDYISDDHQNMKEYLLIMEELKPHNPNYNKIYEELASDYCIAIKNKQSKYVLGFLRKCFAQIDLAHEFELPVDSIFLNDK